MNSTFENIPQDKKQKIVEVCIDEFSQKGYDKASTNTIVKNAGISKGLLFHYFKSKKKLYMYVVDYIINKFLEEFNFFKHDEPKDIFEKIMYFSLKKVHAFYQDPRMYEISLEAFVNPPKGIEKEMKERYDRLFEENLPAFFKNLDTTRFRDDINHQKAVEMVMLTCEAIGNKYIDLYKKTGDKSVIDFENIIEDYKECIEMLKHGIYK